MNALHAARTDSTTTTASGHTPLRDHVARSVRRYLQDLDGCDVDALYDVVLREIDVAMLVEVMRHCEGNQSKAAATLGLNRATLRKKLKEYGLA